MDSAENPDQFGILFDLDGTIVDSMPLLKEDFKKAASMMGIDIDPEMQKRIGKDLRMIMSGRPSKFLELKFIWRIGRILPIPLWKRILLVLTSYQKLKRTAHQAPPVNGAVQAIELLRRQPNVKLGLVTSRSRKDTIRKLRTLGLLDSFSVIVARDDVQSLKPSSEQIRVAASMLGLQTEHCVLVGDMPTDVDAAKNIGALSVAVATGIFPDEVKSRNPDFVIDSVADLPEVLPEILKKMPTLGSDGVRIKAL